MTMMYLLFKPQLNSQLLRGGLPDLTKLGQNPTIQGNSILWCFLSSPFQNHIKKLINWVQFSSVQSLSRVWLFATPWNHSMQGLPVQHQLPEFIQTRIPWVVMPSSHLILCRPLLLPPSIFPIIRVFSNKSVLRIRWPKYGSFSFSISPCNECSELIAFRIDWLDLLLSKGLSRVFSSTTVQQHQFFGSQLSLWSNSHIHTWLLKNHSLD